MSKKYLMTDENLLINLQKDLEEEDSKRFFVPKCNEGLIILEGEEHNHLTNVMRLQIGDVITLICNDEYDYIGNIVEINKKFTKINIIRKQLNSSNPKLEITAFVAVNKKEPMSLIVRMLSELGVTNLIPIKTKWTQSKDEQLNIERYQKIADQSAKQCRRSKTLKILNIQKLDEVCKSFGEYDKVYFAYEKEDCQEKFNTKQTSNSKFNKVAFIVGPVAGFDKDEANQIVESGAVSVSLGRRILKADTACVAMATLLMNYFDV